MSWHNELKRKVLERCGSAVPFQDLVGNRDPALLDAVAETLVLYAEEKGRITQEVAIEDYESECLHEVGVS